MLTQKPKLLLRNARLLNPEKGLETVSDILIENGIIQKIGRNIKTKDAEVWDLPGKCVAPGFIDLHCHLREPGREDEETIKSGTMAALAGGFTTVCCMPNTTPAIDNETTVRAIIQESERVAQARVLPIGAATKGRTGGEVSEMGAMVAAGAVAVSDDGDPVADAEVMRRVLEYSKIFDIPVISHCEEKTLSRGGIMHEGAVSARLGMPGIPACAEEMIVARDILLAEATGARLHIAHVSTRGSVEIIRWAKSRGITVTCETCPHYFTLTDECVASFDAAFKVNPPLRAQADVDAIKEGLSDGTIDVIATDHAPHLASEKDVEFERAPFGMIGFETAFALGITELVNWKVLSLNDLIARLTIAPAAVLSGGSSRPAGEVAGLRMPDTRPRPGIMANLVVFDPKLKWQYQVEAILSQSRNSPFIGRELIGKVLATIIGTRVAQF
jgi:dihydroorotase